MAVVRKSSREQETEAGANAAGMLLARADAGTVHGRASSRAICHGTVYGEARSRYAVATAITEAI